MYNESKNMVKMKLKKHIEILYKKRGKILLYIRLDYTYTHLQDAMSLYDSLAIK